MRKYPLGVQTFEDIINGGYLYIDKTALVYELVSSGKYFFLSRPRRFGKSLLVSTLESYFQGRKDLFQGLALQHLEQKWDVYPIFHIDLATKKYEDGNALDDMLLEYVTSWEQKYGCNKDEIGLERRFAGVVRRACEQTGRQVVILVDEYDKPLVSTFENEWLQDQYRATLKAFYSVLKSHDRYIHFALLTGVTKFSKVSIFSDLNNLIDISMTRQFCTLCGITEEELHSCMDQDVRALAEANGMMIEETYSKLKLWYDGYLFNPKGTGVYNPFSLMNAFYSKDFGSYWYATGTPTFLSLMVKNNLVNLQKMNGKRVTADVVSMLDSLKMDPIPILYQSGYLTIKGNDEDNLILGYPNEEVRMGFVRQLMEAYSNNSPSEVSELIATMRDDVISGQPNSLMESLKALFANIPFESASKAIELNFRNLVYLTFTLLGFNTRIEVPVSAGRTDMVMLTDDFVYIFEFKIDRSAQDAIQQIDEKGYTIPYLKGHRRLFRVGVNFSSVTKNIDDWLIV